MIICHLESKRHLLLSSGSLGRRLLGKLETLRMLLNWVLSWHLGNKLIGI